MQAEAALSRALMQSSPTWASSSVASLGLSTIKPSAFLDADCQLPRGRLCAQHCRLSPWSPYRLARRGDSGTGVHGSNNDATPAQDIQVINLQPRSSSTPLVESDEIPGVADDELSRSTRLIDEQSPQILQTKENPLRQMAKTADFTACFGMLERSGGGGRRSREWGRSRENWNGMFVRLGKGNSDSTSERLIRSKTSAGCLSNCESKDTKPDFARRGNSKGRETVGSQLESSTRTSLGMLLGGVVLALGFSGLRFCRPAYAENVVVPPAVVTPLDTDRDEKGTETEAQGSDVAVVSDGVLESKGQSGGKESGAEEGAEEFEPPFGEGSDLTSDPAEVLLRSYLELHPDDKKALQALLFLRLKKGEVNAAGSVLTRLIELEPDNLEWKYVRAQADEFAGDLVQARRGFEEILQIKPLSARAWQGLAVIMHKMGEDEEAVRGLMEAVNKAAEEGQSKEARNLRMLLGQLHTMQGNLDKAMELYKTVVEEDPQDYRPYLCQGLVYSIIGDEVEAEKYFRRYRKLCPKDFPQRGFLDELMLTAKSEAGKLRKSAKIEEELKKKGRKPPKPMRQPLAAGGGTSSRDNPAPPSQ